MRSEFQKSFANALRRRLHPNTGLHHDQFAHALGCHGETVKNWLRGENCPDGGMVSASISYFTRCGDHAFLQELFPDACAPLIQRREREAAAVRFAESFHAFIQTGAVA